MTSPTEAEREESHRRLEEFRSEVPDGSPIAQITDTILWHDDLAGGEEEWPR